MHPRYVAMNLYTDVIPTLINLVAIGLHSNPSKAKVQDGQPSDRIHALMLNEWCAKTPVSNLHLFASLLVITLVNIFVPMEAGEKPFKMSALPSPLYHSDLEEAGCFPAFFSFWYKDKWLSKQLIRHFNIALVSSCDFLRASFSVVSLLISVCKLLLQE